MNRPRLMRIGALLIGIGVALALIYVVMIAAFVGRENKPEGVTIVNRTDQNVEVFRITASGESRTAALGPDGITHPAVGTSENPCTNSDFVARTETGTEIERRPPPFCRGETWFITGHE